MQDKPNIERLKTMRKFMAELPEEKFDFSEFVSHCGTVCCAAGWLPTMFPNEWMMVCCSGRLSPALRNGGSPWWSRYEAAGFFGLPAETMYAIFLGDGLILIDGELQLFEASKLEVELGLEYPPCTILPEVEDMTKVTIQDWLDRFDAIMDYLGIKDSVL